MNLFQESNNFARWFFQVMKIFFHVRPLTTLTVICADAASSMTRILSMLLPIKVILLAASPGVPKWFPFIDPASKTPWIIGLTIAAVFFFFLTMLLESLVSRMSQDAGKEILYRANELALLKNQEQTVQGYYASFCGICSSLLFLSAAYLVLLILNLQLFLFMVVMAAFLFLFSAWAVSGYDINPGRLKNYIQEDAGGYTKIMTSISFLGAFLVIIIPFIISGGGNIIIAILSIILIRRSLGFIVSSTRSIIKLCKDKHQINALIFPEVQIIEPENLEKLAVRDLFHKSARQEMSRQELEKAGTLSGSIEAHWMDPTAPGVYMFLIKTGGGSENHEKFYQLQTFPQKSAHFFENEDFLFIKISRKDLMAPALITRFSQGLFSCQILDYGLGQAVPAKTWQDVYDRLLEHFWTFQPPKGLIKAFTASHPLLHQNLNPEFLSRVEMALDTGEEKEDYSLFRELLPSTVEILESMPLYIHNPDMNMNNTAQTDTGQIFIMTWGRWSLKPAGTVLPYDREKTGSMADKILKTRDDTPENLSADHIFFVSNCQKLENEIKKGAFKAALQTISSLLKSPVYEQTIDTKDYNCYY